MEVQDSPGAHHPNLLDLAAEDPPTFQSNHEVQIDQGVETNQGPQWNQDTQSDQGIMQDEQNHDNKSGWSPPLAMSSQGQMKPVPSDPSNASKDQMPKSAQWMHLAGTNRFEQTKSILAAIGLLAIITGILRAVR